MLKLNEGEKLIIAFHRHWVVVAQKMMAVSFLLLIAVVALAILPSAGIPEHFETLSYYAITAYLLVVTMIGFVFWMDYYLDVWIVTNHRIIDVEQIGMFKRKVSEFHLFRVQDITVEIPGFMGTLLKYGNLRVQTAGEEGFEAKDIPDVDHVKEVILSEVRKARSV